MTFRELINHFGSASAAIAGVPELARKGGRDIRLRSVEAAERELAMASAAGARFVALGEADYPVWLRTIDGAPPLIAARGGSDCLVRPIIAIVGARNASVAGRKFAAQIAVALGEAGFAVASGLARGIDAAAHAGALARGTIAVFAGGLDRPYPAENVALANTIVERGGNLISEMPMGWEPRARDFPRRNRLISGISVAVVVVEAALRSGSLITARLAGEQGRLVFAVPGSPLDPRAGGTNQLIRGRHHYGSPADADGADAARANRPSARTRVQRPQMTRTKAIAPALSRLSPRRRSKSTRLFALLG